jgi:hypothetical protein
MMCFRLGCEFHEGMEGIDLILCVEVDCCLFRSFISLLHPR